ncbi:hypothetical protein BC827DRAFT_320055 [Russula dissimulans]|nr:hypothetical protein BC827DRAFT_320055 [Russula dissimulans]
MRVASLLTTACRLPSSRLLLWHIGVVSAVRTLRHTPWVPHFSLHMAVPGLSALGNWMKTSSPVFLSHVKLINGDRCSAQSLIAQGSHFPLRKPAGFHYDFALLGLLGIPTPNGLIPQAPIHTHFSAVFIALLLCR